MKKYIALLLLAACMLTVGCEYGGETPMDEELIQNISAELSNRLTSASDDLTAGPSVSGSQAVDPNSPSIILPPVSDLFVPGVNPFLYANAEEGMQKEQGELRLYGDYYNVGDTDGRYFIYEYEGRLRYTTFEAYAQDQMQSGRELCFRKGCEHAAYSECPAYLPQNRYENSIDDSNIVLDFHDSAKAPVLYSVREAYGSDDLLTTYIEAYDLSGGIRKMIYSRPTNQIGKIERISSYGDWLFLQTSDCRLYRLDKSGDKLIEAQGLPFESDQPLPDQLQIIGLENDRLYIMLESFGLYSVSLDLEDVRLALDFSPEPWNGLVSEQEYLSGNLPFCYIYDGYLYYMDDMERVAVMPYGDPDEIKCNLYRLPLDDLRAAPERILSGIAHASDYHRYAEDYLYYEVLDLKGASNTLGKDISSGEMRILDLATLQDHLILKQTNLTMLISRSKGCSISFVGHKNGGKGSLGNYSFGNTVSAWLSPDGSCIREKEYLYTGYMEAPTYRDAVIYKFELE